MMTKNVERKNVEGEAYIKSYHDPDFPSLNSTDVYHDRRYHSCRPTIYSYRWLYSLNKLNDWILDNMNLLLIAGQICVVDKFI